MEEVKEWLNNFYINNNNYLSFDSCLFIIGNSGIGKTYNINKLCNDFDLYKINIDSLNCLSSNDFYNIIITSISSSLIQIITNNNKKKIIIIDDFDTLLSLDTTINITLYNILKKTNLKNIPIICISSLELIKKIGDIKKKCKIIKISNLNKIEVFNIIKKYNKYDIIDDNKINDIIEKTNCNISQCFKQLEDINNKHYKIDELYNIDYLYNYNVFNRNIIKKILNTEPWIIILNFHENLIYKLNNNKIIKKDKITIYKKYIDNFCLFDNLISNIYNFDIAIEVYIYIIYNILILKYKNNKTNNINFTKILSYLSLQKKGLKYNYNNNIPYNHIGNYHINIINRKIIYYN